jgi:hypothetical protein
MTPGWRPGRGDGGRTGKEDSAAGTGEAVLLVLVANVGNMGKRQVQHQDLNKT